MYLWTKCAPTVICVFSSSPFLARALPHFRTSSSGLQHAVVRHAMTLHTSRDVLVYKTKESM